MMIRKDKEAMTMIRLDARILSTGQWKDGKILLNRAEIRLAAREEETTIRQVLYETAYHELFHGYVEPFGKLVSWFLGIDDIYEFSQEQMLYEQKPGYWYRTEEWAAEAFGRLYSRRRDRFRRRRRR